MDANKHFEKYLVAIGSTNLADIDANELVSTALKFAIWPSVSTYENSPWLAPFAIRRARTRTEINAPGKKRDLWGLPTDLGYFADDNSLINKLPMKKQLYPETNPYGNRTITKGLVCCHIWPATTTAPLLFSFVPNLVWLPKSLAYLSDAHLAGEPHPVHYALRKASLDRYGTSHPNKRVSRAWELLELKDHVQMEPYQFTEIVDAGKISLLAKQRTQRMIGFLESTLNEGAGLPPRFSKRYHAGHGPGIDKSVLKVQDWLSSERREQLIKEMRECFSPN